MFLKVVIEIISSNLFTPKKVEGKRGGINNLNEENKIGYYAVIPATILFNKELKANEKLLYAIITILSNKEGYCFASNAYLSNLLDAQPHTISKWVSHLRECGFVCLDMIKNSQGQEMFFITRKALNEYIECNKKSLSENKTIIEIPSNNSYELEKLIEIIKRNF